MRWLIFAAMFSMTASCAFGFFGIFSDDSKKEKKMSELMMPANALITQAEEAYSTGDGNGAVRFYRQAKEELERVERDYPKRAASAEFSPLRFRKAFCETQIDRILLETVNATARTVGVSDTAELERRRAASKQMSAPLTPKDEESGVTIDTAALHAADEAAAMNEPDPSAPVDLKHDIEWVKDLISMQRFDDAEKSLLRILRAYPDDWNARFLMACVAVQESKHLEAEVLFMDLLDEQPKNLSVSLLYAASLVASGKYAKAMTTLDAAIRIDPRQPAAYYNMAWLLYTMQPNQPQQAERYYQQALKLGGSRDEALEQRLRAAK